MGDNSQPASFAEKEALIITFSAITGAGLPPCCRFSLSVMFDVGFIQHSPAKKRPYLLVCISTLTALLLPDSRREREREAQGGRQDARARGLRSASVPRMMLSVTFWMSRNRVPLHMLAVQPKLLPPIMMEGLTCCESNSG